MVKSQSRLWLKAMTLFVAGATLIACSPSGKSSPASRPAALPKAEDKNVHPQDTSKACESNPKLQVFTYPDGRTLYTDFGKHSGGDVDDIVKLLVGHPNEIDAEMLTRLDVETARMLDGTFIPNFRARVKRLRDLIASNEIAWIGVEHTADEFKVKDQNNRNFGEGFAFLQSTLKKKGASDELTERIMMVLAGNPAQYVWFADKKIQSHIRFVPLESKELISGERNQAANADAAMSALSKMPESQITKAQVDQLSAAIKRIMKERKQLSETETKALISKIKDREAKSFAQLYLYAKNQQLGISIERDAFNAKKIHQQKGNGYFSLGGLHEPGTLMHLEKLCHE